jgi:hypothetical protein
VPEVNVGSVDWLGSIFNFPNDKFDARNHDAKNT